MRITADISNYPNKSIRFTELAQERQTTPLKLVWKALYGNAKLDQLTLIIDNPNSPEINKLIRFALTHGVTLTIEDKFTQDNIVMLPLYDLPKGSNDPQNKTTWASAQDEAQVTNMFSPPLTSNIKLRRRAEYEHANALHSWNYFVREHNRQLRIQQQAKDDQEHRFSFIAHNFDFDEFRVMNTQIRIIDAVAAYYEEASGNAVFLVYPGGAMHTGACTTAQTNNVTATLKNILQNLYVVDPREPEPYVKLTQNYSRLYDIDDDDPGVCGPILLSYLDLRIMPDFSWIPFTSEKVNSILSEDWEQL